METEPLDDVLLRHDDRGVCWLTFNRPEQLNVLSNELLDALEKQFAAIAQDPHVRVVVIAAAGKAFCAGHDLKEMRSQSELAQFQALFSRCVALMRTMQKLPQPIIARVQGVATAAGCQL